MHLALRLLRAAVAFVADVVLSVALVAGAVYAGLWIARNIGAF